MSKVAITGHSKNELQALFLEMGEKQYRGTQLFQWIHQKNAAHFDDMTDLPASLRTRLHTAASIQNIECLNVQESSDNSVHKFLFKLSDANLIESVFIREPKRTTICVSSQVGCPLKCSFCATGLMGIKRNLQPFEMIEQVLFIRRASNVRITNVVYMGMGEPFLNYDAVLTSATILSDSQGCAIPKRRITISTAGILPGIQRFTEEKQTFQLAISLTAPTDEQRTQLMPINKKYSLHQILEGAERWARCVNKKVTFEYPLLKGINDSKQDAQRIIQLLNRISCKINIIPFNPIGSAFERPDADTINTFYRTIRNAGITATLRWSRGEQVDAACGQLSTKLHHVPA